MVNFYQFLLFLIVVSSLALLGVKVHQWIDPQKRSLLNRYVYLGEILLFGAVVLVGEFLVLSLVGAYKLPFLSCAVLLSFFLLLDPSVRADLKEYGLKSIRWDAGAVVFVALVGVFVFRNLFFLVDVDSFSTYLFTQRLWLEKGSSLLGGVSDTFIIFLPQFDYVLNSLSLALFGGETFYPALLNLLWRLIVLVLLFGYSKYKFRNSWLGVASVMLVLFNDHFFYSGVNHWVLINGALLAFLFAAVYNFWEARERKDPARFLLACVFVSQLLANKYQMAYVTVFLLMIGFLIQPDKVGFLKGVWKERGRLLVAAGAFGVLSLWFLKNYLVTGDPVYPGFAGRLGVMGWTPEQAQMFTKVLGGISVGTFLKYMSFLFIWPGVKAAKLVLLLIFSFPFVILFFKEEFWRLGRGRLQELSFWLGVSMVTLLGICLMCNQDSRFFRFPLPVFALAAVYGCHLYLTRAFHVPDKLAVFVVLALAAAPMANEGWRVCARQGGAFRYPTIQDNVAVLTGRLKTADVIKERYPDIEKARHIAQSDPAKFQRSAWDMDAFKVNIPQFWLPQRPVVSLWYSNLVSWDSYADRAAVIKDFKEKDLDWVIGKDQDEWKFIPVEDYASKTSPGARFPSQKFFAYSGIPELDGVK